MILNALQTGRLPDSGAQALAQPTVPSVIVRAGVVALKAILTATVVAPVLIGIYEVFRTKSFDILYRVDKLSLPFEIVKRGLHEIWGEYPTQYLETMAPDAVKAVVLEKLSAYQLSVLASREAAVQAMEPAQISYLLRCRDQSVVVGLLTPNQVTEQFMYMVEKGFRWGTTDILLRLDVQAVASLPLTADQIVHVSKCVDIDLLIEKLDSAKRGILLNEWIANGFSRVPSIQNLQSFYVAGDAAQKTPFLNRMDRATLNSFFTTPHPGIDLSDALHRLTNNNIIGLYHSANHNLSEWVVSSATDRQLEAFVEACPDAMGYHLPTVIPRSTPAMFDRMSPVMWRLLGPMGPIFQLFNADQANAYLDGLHKSRDIFTVFKFLNRPAIEGLTASSLEKVVHVAGVILAIDHQSLERALWGKNSGGPEEFKREYDSLRQAIGQIGLEKLLPLLARVGLTNHLFLLLSPEQIKAIDFTQVNLVIGNLRKYHYYETAVEDAQTWLLNFSMGSCAPLSEQQLSLRQLLIAQLKQLNSDQKGKLIELADYTIPPKEALENLVKEMEFEPLSEMSFRKRRTIEETWENNYRAAVLEAPSGCSDVYQELRKRAMNPHQTPHGFLGFTRLPTSAELSDRFKELMTTLEIPTFNPTDKAIIQNLLRNAAYTTQSIIKEV